MDARSPHPPHRPSSARRVAVGGGQLALGVVLCMASLYCLLGALNLLSWGTDWPMADGERGRGNGPRLFGAGLLALGAVFTVLTVAACGPLRRFSRKVVVRWALGTLALVGVALVVAGIAAPTDDYLDPRRYR